MIFFIGAVERDGEPLESGFVPIILIALGFDLERFLRARRRYLLLGRLLDFARGHATHS